MSEFNYKAYLASREWGLLKASVRELSGGYCQRCHFGPYQETHHLTYERIGRERLADLMAVCSPCHRFLSGVSDDDPIVQNPGRYRNALPRAFDQIRQQLRKYGSGVAPADLVEKHTKAVRAMMREEREKQ